MKEPERLERPKIKYYFKKGFNFNDIVKVYRKNTNLFNYTKAIDIYCDQLEKERVELKEENQKVLEANNKLALGGLGAVKLLQQELQTLKDAVHWVLGQHGVPKWIIDKLKNPIKL